MSNQLLFFNVWNNDDGYQRWRTLPVITTETATLTFRKANLGVGSLTNFNGTAYKLLIDGVERATATLTGGRSGTFTFNTSQLSPGWHLIDIAGATGGEKALPYFFYLKRGAVTAQPFIPVVRGAFSLEQSWNGTNFEPYSWGWMPGTYSPRTVPLSTTRAVENFSTPLSRSQLHVANLVPNRRGDPYRTTRNADGIDSACDYQPYFWTDQFLHTHPRYPLQDGPRGAAALGMLAHIEPGRAIVSGSPRHTVYAVTSHSFVKLDEAGAMKTLAGWRHPSGAPTYYYNANVATSTEGLELVGDWSSVPVNRRGFREAWGMAWDDTTLGIDTNAAPVPSENNEQPHVAPVVAFIADTQNNRIVKLTWTNSSSSPPSPPASRVGPVCTEFITGLSDPWAVVYYDGHLYISERTANRISKWSASTGAFVSTLISGAGGLAQLSADRKPERLASLSAIRAEPCIQPEGLARIRDNADSWLYFGSMTSQDVRRVNMDTGAWEIVCPDFIAEYPGTSYYAQIALSDGTFGPRGTVFVATWSNTAGGNPFAWLPSGFTDPNNGTRHWDCFSGLGGEPKGQYVTGIYCTAVGVGMGKCVVGFSNEGLQVWTKAQVSDPVLSAAVTAGAIKWRTLGYEPVFGANGYSMHSAALPWGVDSDIDAFLTFHGHTP